MTDVLHRAQEQCLVRDFAGRAFVAVHPGYAAPPCRYAGVLAARVVICVLCFAVLVLDVVAQVVPYGRFEHTTRDGLTYRRYRSLWRSWSVPKDERDADYSYMSFPAAMNIVAVIFFVVSAVLSAVFASAWTRGQHQRVDEERNSGLALMEYGRRRHDLVDAHDTSVFPYTNAHVMNYGQVKKVPLEKQEQRRRQLDKDLSASLLTMLIVGSIFSLTAACMMGTEIQYAGDSYYYDGHYYYETKNELAAGFPLMVTTTGLAVITFILVSIPQLTDGHLCSCKKLKPTRCTLMAVDDVSVEELNAEVQNFTARTNPLQYGVQRSRVELVSQSAVPAAVAKPPTKGYDPDAVYTLGPQLYASQPQPAAPPHSLPQ